MVNTEIKLKGLTLRNPVMTASGTFGYGEEYTDFVNLSELGLSLIHISEPTRPY